MNIGKIRTIERDGMIGLAIMDKSLSAVKQFAQVGKNIHKLKSLRMSLGVTNTSVQIQDQKCKTDQCTTYCPHPWEEKDGQCYLWNEEKLFWDAAEERCYDLQSHLVSVTSQDVHDYLLLNVRII